LQKENIIYLNLWDQREVDTPTDNTDGHGNFSLQKLNKIVENYSKLLMGIFWNKNTALCAYKNIKKIKELFLSLPI
jgi:hypothetical protein